MSDQQPKVGEPGYGVVDYQPPTKDAPKPPLRKSPDPREFLNPERYRSVPTPPPSARKAPKNQIIQRQGPVGSKGA